MVRQGDLLIVPMRRRDSSWFQQPKTIVADGILAFGEVTGHVHRVEGQNVAVYDTERFGRIIEGHKDFRIVHEEHAPIALRAGAYRVIRQREFDETQIVRYVSD